MNSELGSNNLELRDYWSIVVRRRWCLIVPFFLFGWLGFLVARVWPYLYRSEAMILVEPQRVPAQYVTPNVNANQQDRVESMKQQILSRTHLQRLIEQFNLYPRERAHMLIEDVIDKMRSDISVEPEHAKGRSESLTAVRISYATKDPRVAQQITNELTSLFIEENDQERTQQSVGTTTFLENELERARKDLADQEQRQREYKLRYLGELPEQQQANLQILSSLETQLHAATDSLDRAERQKIYLESMREQYLAMRRALGTGPGGGPITPAATAEAALVDLRRQLVALEGAYTPQHPDIIRLKEKIAQLEALKQRLEVEQTSHQKGGANATTPSTVTGDTALIEVESRLKVTVLEIQDIQKEMEALRARIREFQSRLNLTPVREQQLSEVVRTYENSRQYYQSLLQKKLQSELATNLEKRQQGEQLRIIDPANLPTKPDKPTPLQVLLAGWALGLGAGVGAIYLQESTDEVLRSEKDISSSTKLPVLVRIPILHTPGEETRRRWHHILELTGITLLIALSLSTGVYTYLAIQRLIGRV